MTVCLLLQAPEERQDVHAAGRKQSPALMKRGRFFIGSSIVEAARSAQTNARDSSGKNKAVRSPLQATHRFNTSIMILCSAPEWRPASLARACA
jgi:hypothetical protein